MHEYATDVDRFRTTAYLAIAAVVVAGLIDGLLAATGVRLGWQVEAPGTMVIFGVVWKAFDLIGWRCSIGPIRLSPMPDLAGAWVGVVRSSHHDGDHPGLTTVLHIRQTWTRISIVLATGHSRSTSTMAALHSDQSSQPGLRYAYLNMPAELSVVTMQTHEGTASLRLKPDEHRLIGGYYNGRGRGTVGELEFERSV